MRSNRFSREDVVLEGNQKQAGKEANAKLEKCRKKSKQIAQEKIGKERVGHNPNDFKYRNSPKGGQFQSLNLDTNREVEQMEKRSNVINSAFF